MNIAKALFSSPEEYADIKAELSPGSYIECGNCGAIKVEARELAKALDNVIFNVGNDPTWLSENCEDFFDKLAESIPDTVPGDDWGKWYKENEWRMCKTLDEVYCFPMCLTYSEVVLYPDSSCSCFNKGSIPFVHPVIFETQQTLPAGRLKQAADGKATPSGKCVGNE